MSLGYAFEKLNLNGSKAPKNYGHSKTEIMFGIPMCSGILLLYCNLFGDELFITLQFLASNHGVANVISCPKQIRNMKRVGIHQTCFL